MAKKKYHNMTPKERMAYWEEEREKNASSVETA